MVNSKQKGKNFELKVAHMFMDWGYPARRTQQFSGANGDADIQGVPYLSIECKARERMELYDWMEQSKRDAQKNGRLPVVVHKKNNCDVLVTMVFDDFMKLYRAYELSKGEDITHDKDSKGIKSFRD